LYITALAVVNRTVCVLSIQQIDAEQCAAKGGNAEMISERAAFVARCLQVRITCVLSIHLCHVVQEGIGRQPLATMLAPRCSMGACTLDAGTRVIVCGGYDRGECLCSVEQYDVVANVWTSLAPMCRDRGRCSAAVAVNAEGK
jgi:influenza virus NS1A-binding protein